MLTPKIGGIFDCRKYDQSGKLAHDQRQLLADTDNVTFSALIPIDQVPDVFKKKACLNTPVKDLEATMQGKVFDDFVVPKSSKKEREAAKDENREPVCDVVSVKFKIGANCKWFDKYARQCERPTNAELESKRYMVQLDFTKKEKDLAQPLKPSGYWVNSIMINPIEANPFAGQAFEEDNDPENEPPVNTPAAAPAQAPASDPAKDDLPFD